MSRANGRFAAVFFDLDGTLVSERMGVREARAAVGARLIEFGLYRKPAPAFADTVEMVIGGIMEDNDWQWPLWLHAEEWMKRSLAVEEITVSDDEFRELNQVYRDERSDRAEAIRDWPEALAAARTHGPIGLITNFNDGSMQREKIRGAGLEGQFDGIYISGEVGVWKPEPGIFEHAANDLGVDPGECVHIGNNIQSDVEGALSAGMKAVLVEEDDRPRPASLNGDVAWCEDLQAVADWLLAGS
ncbi:MAG: HAD family hydrolase [Chloroflexota bacterium]|nr:HAD family hydrolase [Chloroflexota bacterium]